MYIKSLEINNIKSISNFKMDFKNPAGWHVIIGDNGSGKSSVVKAIALALLDYPDILAARQDFDEWLKNGEFLGSTKIIFDFKGPEVSNQFIIEKIDKDTFIQNVHFRGVKSFEAKPKNLIPGILSVKSEIDYTKVTTTQQQPPPTPTPTPTPTPQFNIPLQSVSIHEDHFFSCAFGPFRRFSGGDVEIEKSFKSNPHLGSHLTIFGEDVALSEALNFLKNQYITENLPKNGAIVDHFLDDLKDFINNSDLLPHSTKISDITKDIVYIIDGNGLKIDALQMSDGYRSMISMIFELIRQLIRVFGKELVFKNKNSKNHVIDLEGVVIIDEIDAHLHPSWQTKIGQWFTKYFPKIQFIVTTHSPLICRASENGSIWKLNAPGSETQYVPVTGIDKDKLVFGNILDAYGTEIFGKEPVRSFQSNEKLNLLSKLNILSAFGKITNLEEEERKYLQQILQTDA